MANEPATTAPASGQNKAGRQPPEGIPAFYRAPIPLATQRHRALGLNENFGVSFAATFRAVPVNVVEMPYICHAYPIAFSPDDTATPFAILGLRDDENLFVDRDGEWLADVYIPSYIRRYPFIFLEEPGTGKATLYIDNAPGLLDETTDRKLFDAAGKPSTLLQNAIELCKSYHAAAQQTLAFSEALAASGILKEPQSYVTIDDGEHIDVGDIRIIDENKLADLPEKDFLEWRRHGWLPYVYAHLFSASQWQRLSMLLRHRLDRDAGH